MARIAPLTGHVGGPTARCTGAYRSVTLRSVNYSALPAPSPLWRAGNPSRVSDVAGRVGR